MTDDHQAYNPYEGEQMPEGEETAPPYTRTMAIVRWVLLTGMTAFAMLMILHYLGATPWQGASAEPTLYHCPMHPTYVSSQPGECPICGMNLVPIEQNAAAERVADSVALATRPDSSEVRAKPGQYTCPMDPEVISDVPGKCSICGMNLELVTGDSTANSTGSKMPESSAAVDDSLPGLVPVTIESERLQLIGLKTGRVEMRNLGGELRLLGYVTPDETKLANLHVRVSGWVQQLHVNQTGQQVSAGEDLLSLYSPELYDAQQSFIVSRSTDGQRNRDSLLTTIRTQVSGAARQRLSLLGMSDDEIAKLESNGSAETQMSLRSPFSGIVLQKNVNEGQYVTPEQNLFTIADLSDVWVLADVYEQDLPKVKVGQKVEVSFTGLPGETLSGTVQFIYPTVAEQTRTTKVRNRLSNPQLRLRPGMYADVTLETGNLPALVVPTSALMDGGTEQYVFLVHDNVHFEPRAVVVGRRTDDWVEILSGLNEGDTVVTSANFLIDSESRLKAAISGMRGNGESMHSGHGDMK